MKKVMNFSAIIEVAIQKDVIKVLVDRAYTMIFISVQFLLIIRSGQEGIINLFSVTDTAITSLH